MGQFTLRLSAVLSFLLATTALADVTPTFVRVTVNEDTNSSFDHILSLINAKTGRQLTARDFQLMEDRDLAFNHYKRYAQLQNGVPVHNGGIRVWTNSSALQGAERLIQMEANIFPPPTASPASADTMMLSEFRSNFTEQDALKIAYARVRAHSEDANIRGTKVSEEWNRGRLVRLVTVKGKRGTHEIRIDLQSRRVLSQTYREFPQSDDEISIPVQVYPVYEESGGQILPRVPAWLNHVRASIPSSRDDLYASLRSRRYVDQLEDPVLGTIPSMQAQGYWFMTTVKEQAAQLRSELALTENNYLRGLYLQGKYATIQIHPDALAKFGPFGFDTRQAPAFFPNWVDAKYNGQDVQEMIPTQAWYGKPLLFDGEALTRPARRLPDHDPKQYIGDGFDELQVYYAINTLFEELHARGWTDPELSTRPINAFLFNPDISYRDNAFYTDDTINFTTYSPDQPNAARDNSTIWHELGHGVMDRLMGDAIELADTGGLAEGMADFVAAMVIRAKTQGVPFPGSDSFRIINHTGFNLTNEVHDDGEAYGGTMKDFMDAVITTQGQKGLDKVVDVVLEAMRLARDYPGLTAPAWFNHILFADSLGRPGVRSPGELSPFLTQALGGRNFKFDPSGDVATMKVVNTADGTEVANGAPGTRSSPILVQIPKDGTQAFTINVKLHSSDQYKFKYPVTLKVAFNGGPLEGAVHWSGEEKGPIVLTLKSEDDSATIPLTVTGTCDFVNLQDGGCKDFAYMQAFNDGDTGAKAEPVAKKRFYVHVKN